MVFHSPNFLIFFMVLLIPYLLLRKYRLYLLAIANAVFYGITGLGILALFVVVSIVTFYIVHWMRRDRLRWLFWVGIGINAGNLIFFKYSLLLLHTLERLIGFHLVITDTLAANIVLPIGISFYTFEFISYLIDVRRGNTVPTRSFVSFWVFVSMFPHLIAGPIMRGEELIPQLSKLNEKRIEWSDARYGIYLVILGLIKKVVIADQIAAVANALFAKGFAISGTEAWFAAYAFCFQIYYDFSAYTDMALGLGYILGVKLSQNFDTPYLSSNPAEFWRRWHITLSRWIRDYIYIGLGGNRKGKSRTQINLFAAMLISGLWHGAMWTFVLWGAIHGALLIVHRWTLALNRWPRIAAIRASIWYRAAAVAVFFQIITWTWVFFRAQNMQLAFSMTWKMMHAHALNIVKSPSFQWVVGLFLLHIAEYLLRRHEARASRLWHLVPFPVRSAAYLGLILVLIYLLRGDKYDFIYFQF